ncbi:GNAT family N-acetyltransferase [Streptomyces sp. NPDC002835]
MTVGPLECSVRVAAGAADREACFAVRKAVFVAEQQVPEDIEYDAYDAEHADTIHVLAVGADGLALGTGRLLHGASAIAKTGGDLTVGALGRLAVRAASRGLGVGAALVRALEGAGRRRGLAVVELHAQTHALGFYERLGYEAYGAEFLDAGMPHLAMRRTLTPP